MPEFVIVDKASGKTLTVEADSPLSEQEQAEVFAMEQPQDPSAAAPGAPGAPAPGSGALQKVAQGLTAARRGWRGMAVGAELLGNKMFGKDSTNTLGAPDPQSVSQIAERAAEATKPGYVPQHGERAGAAIGEMVGDAPIMMATGGGGLVAQAAKGALTNATMTAINEASDRGEINSGEVIGSGIAGGAISAIVPALPVVARAIRGTGKTFAKSGTSLSHEAIDEAANNPQLMEQFKGTADEVGKAVTKVQKTLIGQFKEAGTMLEKARAKIGFREPFESAMDRVEKEGFQPADIQELIGDYKILSQDKIPVTFLQKGKTVPALSKGKLVSTPGGAGLSEKAAVAEMTKSGISVKKVGEQQYNAIKRQLMQAPSESAMEYTTIMKRMPASSTTKEVTMPPKARLRDLVRLREKLDDLITYPKRSIEGGVQPAGKADEHLVKQMRKKVNDIIGKIPGGDEIRASDEAYHAARELFDGFQNELSTPGKAEDLVRRVVLGGNLEDMVGRKADYLNLMKQLEKAKGGKGMIKQARGSFAAREFKDMKNTGWTGWAAANLAGPEGLAKTVAATEKMAQAPEWLHKYASAGKKMDIGKIGKKNLGKTDVSAFQTLLRSLIAK